MSQANPIIISDLSESAQEELNPQVEPAKDSSEQATSSDVRTRNEDLTTFTRATPPNKRLQASRWFLTFPQTTTTKEEASQRLQQHPQLRKLGIKGFMIAQETHKDTHLHLHVALWLKKQLSTRDRKFFDFVCKKHGNYTIMKSGYGSVNYLRLV